MKKHATQSMVRGRNPELGAIAIVVASLWMTLFGLAAFAVDIGYSYTNKRGLKAVADAAVRAGMKTYATSDRGTTAQNTARTAALSIASANGYTSGVTVSYPTAPNRLQVDMTMSQPTFFLKLFGFGTRNILARSSGEITAGPLGPAIYSNDGAACGTQWDMARGINVQGGGLFTVNGNMESRNKIHIGNPSGLCNGVTCRITGTVRTPCTFWNDAGTSVIGVGATATAIPSNPIPAFAPACTNGTTTLPLAGVPCNPDASCPGGCLIPNGIYCSNTNINVSPTSGSSICTNGASFFSSGGTIIITGDGNITLNPHPSAGGIVAYTTFNAGAFAPTIQLSNGPLTRYTINGHVYAPNGLINVGSGSPGFTMTGTLGGYVVNISTGPNQPWVFNSGGATGSTWEMYE
jgi:hypothetical protein